MKVLITGASSGIGLAMAKYLSLSKHDLILVSRNKEKLEEIQEKLPTKVTIIVADLANEQKLKELYAFVKKLDIDVLINNAGFGLFGNLTETDINKEMEMIDVNIKAVHILTKLIVKDMEKKNSGYILNVASSAAFQPGPLMATYYATKNYVVSLTRAIRKELKKNKSNVKIGLLCPGPVDTNFNNVANVKFKAKGMSSEYVAKFAVDKLLKNKFIIIPGLTIKLTKFFAKIMPSNIIEEFCYHIQVAKNK